MQAGRPSGENEVQVDLKTEEADSKEDVQNASSDYFVGYQLQRNNLRSKMTEEYMNILTNPKSSKKELEEAQRKIDELMKVDKTESVLEELIRNEGFRDAVVISGDKTRGCGRPEREADPFPGGQTDQLGEEAPGCPRDAGFRRVPSVTLTALSRPPAGVFSFHSRLKWREGVAKRGKKLV